MIRYAKVLEIDDHQFLVRLCHHHALANLPTPPDTTECALLTIDTVTPVSGEAEPHMMRMVINCQLRRWQQKCFDAFNEVHCLEVLQLLYQKQFGVITPTEMMEATGRLQASLLAQVGR